VFVISTFSLRKTMALAQCRALPRANVLPTPKAWRLRGRRGNSAGLVVESAWDVVKMGVKSQEKHMFRS
jgi:hypothetical protein